MTTDDTMIRHRIDQLIDGLRARDRAAVARLYTPDVVSFDVEAPLQHVGLAAKLANWDKVFTFFETVDYEVRNLNATIGGDVAFAHGFGRLSGRLQGGPEVPGMWVRITFGLREIDGEWLIAHDQVSVPLDIATGAGVVDLEP
ncbi:nuclear transport factor 2 family protein [Nocardia sp. NPDC048505]|uniref:YybH family protein n=1 Tax=Nocardia sp. NPDC048505 TaxID=3155756 RepID=UPI0033D5A571